MNMTDKKCCANCAIHMKDLDSGDEAPVHCVEAYQHLTFAHCCHKFVPYKNNDSVNIDRKGKYEKFN